MMRKLIIVLVGAFAAPVWADERPGTVAAPILQVPVGARSAGMGSAFTAIPDDLEAIHYNPAGLASLSFRGVGGSFMRGLEDQNIQSIDIGWPTRYNGIFGMGGPVFGGSLLISQNGTIEVNRTNPDGSLQSSQNISAGGDLIGAFTYAERLADTPILTDEQTEHVYHHFGATGKVIRSSLVNQYSATAIAGDVGYLAHAPELGLSAGAAVLNAGTKMKYISYGDELPLTLRGGAAYQFARYRTGVQRWTLASDGDFSVYEKIWHVNAGLEYSVLDSISARAGYQFHQDLTGLTVGFGMHWGPLAINYAWAMARAISDSHRIGLTYKFSRMDGPRSDRMNKGYITESPDGPDVKSQPKPKPEKRKLIPDWIY